ncbi:MAG: J domain-containing protein [Spirochaetales bacterium]|nr:J domain-containing protein [Spirochaetales bacterium]
MSDFFDQLGTFFKSIFNEGDNTGSQGGRRYYDDDMQDAWDELEDYLNEGKGNYQKKQRPSESSSSSHSDKSSSQGSQRQQVPNTLKQDYANLKVPFGASLKDVREAYKKLLRQYHPDRHARDPEKFKMATEITSKINQSYQNIEDYLKKTGNR